MKSYFFLINFYSLFGLNENKKLIMRTLYIFISVFVSLCVSKSQNLPFNSFFTKNNLTVDGQIDKDWAQTSSYPISKFSIESCTTCVVSATAKSLWNGTYLYFLVEVKDDHISTTSSRPTEKDGVELYIDWYNDKFPKYEEDDYLIRVTADGQVTGTGSYQPRLVQSAVQKTSDGYIVEISLKMGDLPRRKPNTAGIEIGVMDAKDEKNTTAYKIFWSSAQNNGLNDNTKWGNLTLAGKYKVNKLPIDDYDLQQAIGQAQAITRNIWEDESKLNKALHEAQTAKRNQKQIDAATKNLTTAINGLRRKGHLSDPKDLPEVIALPDPFAFKLKQGRVENATSWPSRVSEIKQLAQYYEYGTMPQQPQQVTATIDTTSMIVKVTDHGKSATFSTRLTMPKNIIKTPIPLIVSIDFFAGVPPAIYTDNGYAVLSVTYSTVGSDNNEHKGAFYELYPYDVTIGQDNGTLLAWAWGASRALDGAAYLQEQGTIKGLDLTKVIVTGFSRCGKAALCAGFFDDRFGIVNPGASGCGGAALYRYDSFGNRPNRKEYGNVYDWGRSPGQEVMIDKLRHQGHNSNLMLQRFINEGRIYQTKHLGYGQRLPYDHHEILAAIAPRAILITTAVDDYPNNSEGDALSYEAAKPIFNLLGVGHKLALNIRASGEKHPRGFGGGHWVSEGQQKNLISFANHIFYNEPLSTGNQLYINPYLPTIDKYYGGLKGLMPWMH
jgi:endo-1,4-beta-xylanase